MHYIWKMICLMLLPTVGFALDNFYCSTNHAYVSIGMTKDQVIAACGEPLTKKNLNKPLMEEVPMNQLIYNNQGATKAFYGVWAIPIGNSTPPGYPLYGGNSGGIQLEVSIIKDKVHAIKMAGSGTNGFSICGGAMIKVGDPGMKVYASCGNPSLVNKSFIKVPKPSKTKPEIWSYQVDEYHSPFYLTFLNGQLESISE